MYMVPFKKQVRWTFYWSIGRLGIVGFNAFTLFLWGYVEARFDIGDLALIEALEESMEAFIRERPVEM